METFMKLSRLHCKMYGSSTVSSYNSLCKCANKSMYVMCTLKKSNFFFRSCTFQDREFVEMDLPFGSNGAPKRLREPSTSNPPSPSPSNARANSIFSNCCGKTNCCRKVSTIPVWERSKVYPPSACPLQPRQMWWGLHAECKRKKLCRILLHSVLAAN